MTRLILLRGVIGSGKSTVAKLISTFRGDIAVVEVDDVKRENPANEGTARHCQPETDFTEAGRRAKEWLDHGWHTLVVEYFAPKEHLDYVVKGAGRQFEDDTVSVVWLNCDLDKVLLRKLDEHPSSFLKQQYGRKNGRYKHNGEIEIDTSEKSPDKVAREVLSKLDLGQTQLAPFLVAKNRGRGLTP